MSYVTSAVIVVNYAPREVEELLTVPQAFGRNDGAVYMQAFGKLDNHAAGGRKVLQSDVYAAGLNHIGIDALDKWFLGLPWGSMGSAVLIYDCEGEFETIIQTPGWGRVGDSAFGSLAITTGTCPICSRAMVPEDPEAIIERMAQAFFAKLGKSDLVLSETPDPETEEER